MIVPMTSEQLRDKSAALPHVPDWEKDTHWGKYRQAMRDHFATNATRDLLCWSTISATMFVGEFHVTRKEVEELKKASRWSDYAHTALMENTFGTPPRMGAYAHTSGNLINQTYHLWQWERKTGKYIENVDRIVEFGGGYGAMCAITRRLGFEGDYYLVDYPEMTLLQEFYLSNIGIDAKYIPADWGTDFRDCLPKDIEVLIALHSLSESPIPQRNNFMSAITPASWLFSYQGKFFNADNLTWFKSLADARKGYEHNFFHNKVNTNVNYLVSWMKGTYV